MCLNLSLRLGAPCFVHVMHPALRSQPWGAALVSGMGWIVRGFRSLGTVAGYGLCATRCSGPCTLTRARQLRGAPCAGMVHCTCALQALPPHPRPLASPSTPAPQAEKPQGELKGPVFAVCYRCAAGFPGAASTGRGVKSRKASPATPQREKLRNAKQAEPEHVGKGTPLDGAAGEESGVGGKKRKRKVFRKEQVPFLLPGTPGDRKSTLGYYFACDSSLEEVLKGQPERTGVGINGMSARLLPSVGLDSGQAGSKDAQDSLCQEMLRAFKLDEQPSCRLCRDSYNGAHFFVGCNWCEGKRLRTLHPTLNPRPPSPLAAAGAKVFGSVRPLLCAPPFLQCLHSACPNPLLRGSSASVIPQGRPRTWAGGALIPLPRIWQGGTTERL